MHDSAGKEPNDSEAESSTEAGDAAALAHFGSGIHRITRRSGVVQSLDSGARIGDRYTIVELISNGATSHVYAAHDERGGREVAIKVVRHGLGDPHERAIDRLQLELFVYQLAQSPHLPSLLDAGRLDDGSPYIVMDRVHGQTLAERLRSGAFSIPAVLELGRQLMSGLHAAHVHGIIHCDIKPLNLLLEPGTDSGLTLKIIDFGICARERSSRSPTSVVLGTPSYMSPEQITGTRLDARVDVYSASVVLYEALTGRLPFDGSSSGEIFSSALYAPVLPPRVLRENCPGPFEALLLRGLSRDPEQRFASAEQMRLEIEHIVQAFGLPSGAAAFRTPSSLFPQAPSAADAQTQRLGLP